MAVKKKGLGRGLDALFPEKQKNTESTESASQKDIKSEENVKDKKEASEKHETKEKSKAASKKEEQESPSSSSEVMVKISKVSPNREQPRKRFDEDALVELSESIKQYGIIQPILVSNKKDYKGENYYEIIAGERRWRAARMAGLKEVPVIIKEFSDQEIVEISLIENIQREDLNPIEEAQAYKRLMDEYHLKQDEVAEKVSRSRTAVANSTRLLKLDERVQDMLINDMISAGHARALLAIVNPDMQYEIAMKLFDEKLSVRETEILVKRLTEPSKSKKPVTKSTTDDAIYESLEEKLKGIVGTKVFIRRKRNHKGKIEIEYYSQDELERILDLFDSIRES
ncbi:MAG: ParB/RepB/Spo0J family partition protein [Lachnospiraceae bacterium]|nr:ParB/RepB/Spo0J family partition protein [Blautia sp.]MBQ8232454.1 ParB/RepB/Spo0J family partition protein [Lachnospiraceae bacterium]